MEENFLHLFFRPNASNHFVITISYTGLGDT